MELEGFYVSNNKKGNKNSKDECEFPINIYPLGSCVQFDASQASSFSYAFGNGSIFYREFLDAACAEPVKTVIISPTTIACNFANIHTYSRSFPPLPPGIYKSIFQSSECNKASRIEYFPLNACHGKLIECTDISYTSTHPKNCCNQSSWHSNPHVICVPEGKELFVSTSCDNKLISRFIPSNAVRSNQKGDAKTGSIVLSHIRPLVGNKLAISGGNISSLVKQTGPSFVPSRSPSAPPSVSITVSPSAFPTIKPTISSREPSSEPSPHSSPGQAALPLVDTTNAPGQVFLRVPTPSPSTQILTAAPESLATLLPTETSTFYPTLDPTVMTSMPTLPPTSFHGYLVTRAYGTQTCSGPPTYTIQRLGYCFVAGSIWSSQYSDYQYRTENSFSLRYTSYRDPKCKIMVATVVKVYSSDCSQGISYSYSLRSPVLPGGVLYGTYNSLINCTRGKANYVSAFFAQTDSCSNFALNNTCARSAYGYTRSDCTLMIPPQLPAKRIGFLAGLTLVQQLGVALICAIILATVASVVYLAYLTVIDCQANAERRRYNSFRFPRNFPSDYLLREDAALPEKAGPDDNSLVQLTTDRDETYDMALSVCGQVEMITAVSAGLIEVGNGTLLFPEVKKDEDPDDGQECFMCMNAEFL